ncbi:Uncharacterised protein [Staphylococcus aureus]|nr:Uncharacterised protein [Staphylococcus aureus]
MKKTTVTPRPLFKTKLFKNAPMNGRLRNTEKSIKGTSCRRSMMMNINVVMIKMLRQMIENVLNQPCSNPCVNNNVKLPIITAKIDIPL